MQAKAGGGNSRLKIQPMIEVGQKTLVAYLTFAQIHFTTQACSKKQACVVKSIFKGTIVTRKMQRSWTNWMNLFVSLGHFHSHLSQSLPLNHNRHMMSTLIWHPRPCFPHPFSNNHHFTSHMSRHLCQSRICPVSTMRSSLLCHPRHCHSWPLKNQRHRSSQLLLMLSILVLCLKGRSFNQVVHCPHLKFLIQLPSSFQIGISRH